MRETNELKRFDIQAKGHIRYIIYDRDRHIFLLGVLGICLEAGALR